MIRFAVVKPEPFHPAIAFKKCIDKRGILEGHPVKVQFSKEQSSNVPSKTISSSDAPKNELRFNKALVIVFFSKLEDLMVAPLKSYGSTIILSRYFKSA